jgi:hypothetical protein
VTVYEARQVLAGPLVFGDEVQIYALMIIANPENITPEQMLDWVEQTREAPL